MQCLIQQFFRNSHLHWQSKRSVGKSNRSSHHFSGITQFIRVDLFRLNLVKHCLLVKPLHVVCNNHDVGRECLIASLSGGEA